MTGPTNIRLKDDERAQLATVQAELCKVGVAETKSEIAHIAIRDGLLSRMRKIRKMVSR